MDVLGVPSENSAETLVSNMCYVRLHWPSEESHLTTDDVVLKQHLGGVCRLNGNEEVEVEMAVYE